MNEWIEEWRREGVVVLPRFFGQEQMLAVEADFETVFGPPEEHLQVKGDDAPDRAFTDGQFLHFEQIPFKCSPALNLLAVDHRLIEAAKEALNTNSVYLYQSQAWAKYTGEANFDQPFHCDFLNHTLTVPSEDETRNSITFLIYVTDVTEAHGPTHYVRKSDSGTFTSAEGFLGGVDDLQEQLSVHEHSAAGPRGTVFAYGIDVFHRGTNLTAPQGYRYAVSSCFRAAGNDSISYSAWPHSFTRPWAQVFNHASPEQLACFGVPPPGNPFWSESTLARVARRWPLWDTTPYKEKLSV